MSEITQQITTYCMSLFSAKVKSALAAAADHLTDLADKTKIPKDRVLYLDTMHELGFNTEAIIDKFDQTMLHAFDTLNKDFDAVDPFKKDGSGKSSSSTSTSLEERLAIDTMSSKARTVTDMQLHSVTRTLNGMMGDDWVQHNGNPLDPENVIKAWVAAIHVVQFEPKGNLAMYGLLNTKVLASLPTMYEDIINFLGKLPSSRSSRFKQSAKPIGDEEADSELAFGDIDEMGEVDGFSANQATEANNSTTQEYDGEPEPELRTDELVSLLDSLQRNRELDDGSFYGGNYLLDIRGLLASFNAVPNAEVNPWTIGQINDDVIDLTGLLFTFIMEDMHIPDEVRFQMYRLQIPYLKLGLQDKSIFINKNHPARQLLNDLSQSVFECNPQIVGGLDRLHSEIKAVIDKILIEYHTDQQIFGLIEQQFSLFLSGGTQGESGEAKQQQDATTQTSKADNARLSIESTLDELCKNQRIPPVVDKIIENFWSKILFLEYLKGGENSEDYAKFIETVKMLVDSVQPKDSELSRKSMAKILPVLIKRLKEGLTTISIASFETVDLFRELQDCHMLVLKERPENEVEGELEVPEDQYEEFKHSQNSITDWNRNDLENALLEESIERSMGYSDSDVSAFDDNKNIIVSKNNFDSQTSTAKSSREGGDSIDHQLNEARDAYEQALKDHQQKKKGITPEDDEDPMVQFFQDPNFGQKQSAGFDNSSSNDEQPIDDTVFNDIEEVILSELPEHYDDEIDLSTPYHGSSNDDLEGRAHGALEEDDEQMGDQQILELIDRLKVGIWVDFIHADGVQVRAKIMAIVPTVGKYIFGDRGGRKLADYNKQSLALALRTGQIKVREEDNVFDKTLESVIANLRLMKKAEDD